ncbi:murein transglycosylase A [Defluviimonas salinarum]|uniref:peptidoglycan lytic exotransglycosylase n=1 Tax=Defluviimonas salinarum TaxID=2992147 RepID=A0ABT3J1D6_9RHOB|nr:MltA domain-containing protein [Defluviimonas salinarum]MCW3781501.1 MltA domain-containing protein [Defluviimonas salinarum]
MRAASLLDFSGLPGWAADDHAAALAAYAVTADLLGADWPTPASGDARTFFEASFTPVEIGAPPGLLTGYYEPEIEGRARRGEGFDHPLYAPPADLPANQPWFNRAEIEAGNLLAGRELVWLADPVEAFLAQVQGSVRVRFEDGSVRRFGFAAKNGQPYRSIGQELTRRGAGGPDDGITADGIRAWCRAHPDETPALLRHNPSFVFFRELDLPPDSGPIGAMGRPVTALRSLAVDPEHIPLGAPVWVEGGDFATLMVAQDTGSAIKGAQRGDIFCGTGIEAGHRAGDMRISGRLVTLLPRKMAERLAR